MDQCTARASRVRLLFVPFSSCPLHRRPEPPLPALCSPCLRTDTREAKPREWGRVQDMFAGVSVLH